MLNIEETSESEQGFSGLRFLYDLALWHVRKRVHIPFYLFFQILRINKINIGLRDELFRIR
jgi:hypothetical protein